MEKCTVAFPYVQDPHGFQDNGIKFHSSALLISRQH